MKTVNGSLHFYLSLFVLFLFSQIDSFAQCADNAELTSNSKCAKLAWTITPSPIPTTIVINGATYNLTTGTANPAQYTNDGSNSNGCNNYNPFSGDITIGTTVCTYANSDLAGSVSLPVSLKYFNGSLKNNSGKLTWATASELNNSGFEIEKSTDGLRWSKIGWVQGTGTGDGEKNYEYYDDELATGINYYRLKQIDFDGAFTYSHIVSINFEKDGKLDVVIFPNPANEIVNVSSLGEIFVESILIYNQLGQQILQASLIENTIDISALEKGVYVMVISVENKKLTKRLVVQ